MYELNFTFLNLTGMFLHFALGFNYNLLHCCYLLFSFVIHINNLQERSGASRFSNPTIHEGLNSPVRNLFLVFL